MKRERDDEERKNDALPRHRKDYSGGGFHGAWCRWVASGTIGAEGF